jgi:hypothetical protein
LRSFARIGPLVRARLAWMRGAWPIPSCVFLAGLSAGLAGLVRGELASFPCAWLGLGLGLLALALPLLSDLGAHLRQDDGEEWIAALPAAAWERAFARAVQVLGLLAALILAWALPWALLASEEWTLRERVLWVLASLAHGGASAALLLWVQQFLLARAPTLWVLVETVLVVGLVIALVGFLGHVPELARIEPTAPELAWVPTTWFARAATDGAGLGPALATMALGIGGLCRLPRTRRVARSRTLLEWVHSPLRRLAFSSWVRKEERASFDLVLAGLPREREFALRTYPMLGIPLAFLWIASSSRREHDGLALLLLTVGVYLPILLTHVPVSESSQASWILRMAPTPRRTLEAGAIKALFVGWILPLYLGLGGLACALGEAESIGKLWLPATLLALLLLRLQYPRCVRDLPLSTAPGELRSELDWAGGVASLAVGLTLLAVVANRFLTWPAALLVSVALLLLERVLERRALRSGPGDGPSR